MSIWNPYGYCWFTFLFEFLLKDSGGDIDIAVASSKELKVSSVREAFQTVFGKATVK